MLIRKDKVQKVVDHYRDHDQDFNEPTYGYGDEPGTDRQGAEGAWPRSRRRSSSAVEQKAVANYKITLASVQGEYNFLAEQEKVLRDKVEKLTEEAKKSAPARPSWKHFGPR